ncbi:16S rRNA (uracil(1498)-N(3))-methyltransferase [Sebaldella sp. S0638]|uniref:RsmE family RNA methyltransferase n=1 Tax=Sebaldella sp. S0638 TaxID=2957809 RepID=UPI00209FB302|nr:16S rRNA (uracil(1498)-N(3))-methyltransferase [Sebaldella sp. S0638]MCP1223954.1 16S rRNA (uracil(1498)-N(3))-methyltransferase [Sebaldella sp. S0638]
MLTIIIRNEDFISGNNVEITQKKDINHIKNVYRYKTGDTIRLIDGKYEYKAIITEIENKRIQLRITEKNEDKYSLKTELDIAFGILKNDKMNIALQKLTEIGVNRIIPLKTDRVVVKLEDSKEKWNTVTEEALKQCRGIKIPEIDKILTLKDINFSDYDKVLFAYENSEENKPVFTLLSGEEKRILYLVGPEGGFTEEEALYIKEQGALEISLGKRIYRAETAAIVIGGILADVYK